MIEFLRYIYLTILLALGIYCIFNFSKTTKLVKCYSILTLIVEIIGFTHLFYFHKPISILYNMYSIFEIVIWSFYFLKLNKIAKKYLFPILTFYFIFFMWLGNFNLLKLNNNGFLLNNAIITFFIAFYFFNIIRRNLNIDGHFWILTGALFYNFGGFLLTGIIQLVAKVDENLGSSLFSINSVLNFCFYSLVLYGLNLLDREFDNSLSNN